MKREQTIGDLSAVVTGILLAFNLPLQVHSVPIIGGLVAIVMVKTDVWWSWSEPLLTQLCWLVSF